MKRCGVCGQETIGGRVVHTDCLEELKKQLETLKSENAELRKKLTALSWRLKLSEGV